MDIEKIIEILPLVLSCLAAVLSSVFGVKANGKLNSLIGRPEKNCTVSEKTFARICEKIDYFSDGQKIELLKKLVSYYEEQKEEAE